MGLLAWWRRRCERRALQRRWREEREHLEKDRAQRRRIVELQAEVATQAALAKGLRFQATYALWWTDQQEALRSAAHADAKAARARVLLNHAMEEIP